MKLPDFLNYELNLVEAKIEIAPLRSLLELILQVGQQAHLSIDHAGMTASFDDGYSGVRSARNTLEESLSFKLDPAQAAIVLHGISDEALGSAEHDGTVKITWHGAHRSNMSVFTNDPKKVGAELFDCMAVLSSETKKIDPDALRDAAEILDDGWFEEDTKGSAGTEAPAEETTPESEPIPMDKNHPDWRLWNPTKKDIKWSIRYTKKLRRKAAKKRAKEARKRTEALKSDKRTKSE